MSKPKKPTPITLLLTDEQMRTLSFNVGNKYPFSCKDESQFYEAELISIWKVTIKDPKDIILLTDIPFQSEF